MTRNKTLPKWVSIETEIAYLEHLAKKSEALQAVIETILDEKLRDLRKSKKSRKNNTLILKYEYFLRRITNSLAELSPTEVGKLTGGTCQSVKEAIDAAHKKMLKRPEFQKRGELRWYCYKQDYDTWLD